MFAYYVLISYFLAVAVAQITVQNVTPGIYSKKTVSNGLNLPATNAFSPITTLTTNVWLDSEYTVFIHYQITYGASQDFFSKLLINNFNAGSLVHTGTQNYKTATGFYMANLNPGAYTLEVHYKSPVAISMPANYDWQTAVLQMMWFKDAYAVSSGIKCYPTPPSTNTYNNFGPIDDLSVDLLLPGTRTILSVYQFSAELSAASHVVSALELNGFHQLSTALLKGDVKFVDLHGTLVTSGYAGIHSINVLYRSPASFTFTDCQYNYDNNKNLYAMMLPSVCSFAVVDPKTSLKLANTNRWGPTDVSYTLSLTQQSHVIIMYQYAGLSGNSHIVMRLSINSVPQPHTVSLTGNTAYAGNYGMWQGPLDKGSHKIVLEYRSPVATTNIIHNEQDFRRWGNRALTVISC